MSLKIFLNASEFIESIVESDYFPLNPMIWRNSQFNSTIPSLYSLKDAIITPSNCDKSFLKYPDIIIGNEENTWVLIENAFSEEIILEYHQLIWLLHNDTVKHFVKVIQDIRELRQGYLKKTSNNLVILKKQLLRYDLITPIVECENRVELIKKCSETSDITFGTDIHIQSYDQQKSLKYKYNICLYSLEKNMLWTPIIPKDGSQNSLWKEFFNKSLKLIEEIKENK